MANSATIGALRVLLSADTASFEKAMAGADASTKKLANTMRKDLEPSQARINSLIRQFEGTQAKGAAENYARAIQQVGGATKLTAQHQEQANATIQKALAHYKALGQQAPAHLLELEKATRRLETPTQNIGKDLDMVVGKFRAMAGLFGVSFGAAAIGSFVKSTFDAADQVVDLSDKMGVSIEAAQRFKFAANQAGAEIDDVSRAIVRMNDTLAEGKKSTVQALKDAGLSFDTIRQMKPEDAFRSIADAIGKIQDPMKQTQIAMELFGKAGAELLPMIRTGALQAADGVKVMSEDTARALEKAKQDWDNFWKSIQVTSATALAAMGPQIQKFLADFNKGFTFLVRFADEFNKTGNLQAAGVVAFAAGAVDFNTEKKAKRLQEAVDLQKKLEGFSGVGDAQDMGSTGFFAPIPFKGRATPAKELTDAQKKYNEEIQKGADILTGKALAQEVQKLADKVRVAGGAAKITAPELKKLREELTELWMQGAKLHPVLDKIRMSGLVDFSGKSSLAQEFKDTNAEMAKLMATIQHFRVEFGQRGSGMFSLEDFIGSAGKPLELVEFVSAEHSSEWARSVERLFQSAFQPPLKKSTESGFKHGMEDALDALPETVLRAFQGGGNVWQSVGSMFGASIAESMVAGMSDKMKEGKLGKMLEDVLPGLGAIGGGLLGKGLSLLNDKLLGGEARRVNDIRDQFMEANGGLEGMHRQIAEFNNDPQLLAAFNRLYFTGDEGDFKSGMEAYQKRLKEIQAALGQAGGKLNELANASAKFGGVLPKSLHAAAQQILGMSGLTGDLRKQLEKLIGQPSWEVLEDRAKALGIDTGALGSGFNQEKVKALALGFVRDIEMFKDAGADVDGVLRGMADEISGLLIEARKTGAQLPKTLEPYIKRLAEMGLLIDEAGNAIDMGAFSFADFEDEALIAMRDLLTEIKDILAKAFPAAVEVAKKSIRDFWRTAEPPSTTAPGTGNGFFPGTNLPGLSSVAPSLSSVGATFAGATLPPAGQTMTLIMEQDGRATARWLVPFIPDEVTRLRLA